MSQVTGKEKLYRECSYLLFKLPPIPIRPTAHSSAGQCRHRGPIFPKYQGHKKPNAEDHSTEKHTAAHRKLRQREGHSKEEKQLRGETQSMPLVKCLAAWL